MKNIMFAVIMAVSAPVMASADLAQKKGCMACHAVDRRLVGPGFNEVSQKHQKTAPEVLAVSISKGGAGRWGPVPMPAQPHVTEAEAVALARWIRALKSGG